jgi:hypothetical protein
MTVAELIAELVALDHSSYLIDARCVPLRGNIVPPGDRDARDTEDRSVLGLLDVITNRDQRPGRPDGWVTLELEAD